jgi:hypothetical protein
MREQPEADWTLNKLTGQRSILPSLKELINQGCGISQALAKCNAPLQRTLKRVPLFIGECQVGFENQKSPFGKTGDFLWVRETCRSVEKDSGVDGILYLADDCFVPIADTLEAADNWAELNNYRSAGGKRGATVPSIHLPRHASRIILKVLRIRAERLQDITEEDAKAEGVIPMLETAPSATDLHRHAFKSLWQSIYGESSWDENPWVWVCEFYEVQK